MAQQRRVKKTDTDKEEKKDKEPDKKDEKSSEDRKKLLDEIDEMIETEGEDFVDKYVQRGGQ